MPDQGEPRRRELAPGRISQLPRWDATRPPPTTARCEDFAIDYEAVISALGELEGVEVIAAIQFADASLNPIAVLQGPLRPDPGRSQRFAVGDGLIEVRREDLSDASWVEGRGEEPALRIDLHNVQITVSPGSEDMADVLD